MEKVLLMAFLSLTCSHSGLVFGSESSLCSQMPYPELCSSLIGSSFLENSSKTGLGFHESAIQSIVDQAQEVLDRFSAMAQNVVDSRAKLAWNDCLELYDDAIHQLNRSMTPMSPTDVQIWLSAALTDHQTCENGLKDFRLSSHLQDFPSVFHNFSKFLGNLLAINNLSSSASASASASANPVSSDGGRNFPEWVSAGDRKLIQIAERGGESSQANLVVAKDGSGHFTTISEAIEASEKRIQKTERFVIYVKSGIYRENVEVKKSARRLTLIGDGIDATVITGNKNTVDGYPTYQTATFKVLADGFIAIGVTFENTAGPTKNQSVAFLSASDYSAFFRCSFKGYQDTLYLFAHRQFYRDCDIYGTVDFIFGDAAVVLQNCNVYVRKPLRHQRNIITAQGRRGLSEFTGFVFHKCRITAAEDLFPVQRDFRTFLGRPWKQYSRVVFLKCNLGGLIDPEGWFSWDGRNSDLDTLYFAEYMNEGIGADTHRRVRWPGYRVLVSEQEAREFSAGNFLDGDSWIPGTGIPFNSGL